MIRLVVWEDQVDLLRSAHLNYVINNYGSRQRRSTLNVQRLLNDRLSAVFVSRIRFLESNQVIFVLYIPKQVLIIHTRNTFLSEKGIPRPTATSTGTTIVGCLFKDGIVLGADTRATEGPIVADKNCEKVMCR